MAISRVRAATALYIVLSAPNNAPSAISPAMNTPMFWMKLVSMVDCSARNSARSHHLHLQPRIRGEAVLELRERLRRGQPRVNRLKRIAAVIGRLQNGGIRPNLRFRRTAAAGENAHDLPVVLPHANLAAQVQSGEGPRGARSHNHLVAARLEVPAFDELDVSRAPRWPSFPTPRIGTLASVPVERLGRLMITNSSAEASAPSGPRARPGASGMRRDLLAGKPAGHFAVGAAAQHDRHVVRPGDRHRRAKTRGNGEHADEHRHDARNADRAGNGGAFALRNANGG